MRIGILFDLFTDTSDVLQFFEGVDTHEQLVSRLERLKHHDTKDLLECLIGMRASSQALYQETFETSSSLGNGETLPEDDLLSDKPDFTTSDASTLSTDVDQEIDALVADFETPPTDAPAENPIPPSEPPAADPNTSATPAT